MREKSHTISAQEQLVYRELTKYVELVAASRLTGNPEDFIELDKKQPSFLVVASSLGQKGQLLLSSHNLSPASLRQEHLDALEMPMVAQYGRTSVTTALMLSYIHQHVSEVIDVAEEIDQMKGGIGHS